LFGKEIYAVHVMSESLRKELEQCRDSINGALELLSKHVSMEQDAREDDDLYNHGPQGAD
jgi:hypothetical protein